MSFLMLILRRLGHAAVLLVAVVCFNFALIHLAPGDPAQVIAGEMGGANPQILAELRAAYHLDRSLPVQLWIYVSHVLHGDLGRSFYFSAPVARLIATRVPATLLLVETVFAWPGLGRLAYDSILRRDSPTILGILVFSAMIVVAVNLLTDLAYRLIDPRIRTGG
jgi:peptide/nickel transport system permease protein